MADFYPADVGRQIVALGGVGTITGYTDPSTVTVTVEQAFPFTHFDSGAWRILGSPQAHLTSSAQSPAGATTTLTLSVGGWRPEDAGKFVRVNGGLVKITSITSATVAQGTIYVVLTSSVGAEAGAWTLNGSMWGGTNGYPRCGVFYQQRLYVAGSPAFPLTVWGSVIREYYDFTLGDLDTDALAYDIATGQLNPVLNLAASKQLIALTSGAEYTIFGGLEKPITPTNIQVTEQSVFGCADVQPVRIGAELMFPQRSAKKIRAMSANQYDGDQFDSPDVTVLSEHITQSGVTSLAHMAEPQSIMYAVLGNGQLGTLTADRDQPVFGWTRQATLGIYEDVAAVPVEGGWAVYAIVARVIGGETRRYIERFLPGIKLDSAIRGHSDAGSDSWGGLAHLEGLRVAVKADGVYMGTDFHVTGGELVPDLPRTANDVEIGLLFTSTINTLTPEYSMPLGSAQGARNSNYEIQVRLLNTIGCTINLQEVGWRQYDTLVLDRPPAAFTGDKTVQNLGWGQGVAEVLIQQTLPYDFHILSMVTKFQANEG